MLLIYSAVAISWPRITNMNRTTSWIFTNANAGTDTSSKHDPLKQQVPSYSFFENDMPNLDTSEINLLHPFYKHDG